MTIMVYDLETIPDIEAGRRLLQLHEEKDNEVLEAMLAKRLEKTQGNSDFLPHYLQKIVAISVVVSREDWVKVWSIGELESDEETILKRFFNGIEKYSPVLVSWNGSGFDLPVLHYRSLLHGVSAPRYWEIGEKDANFRWNNYLGRYHYRHTDIMDVLSLYQPRAFAPLDELAIMLGLPGKMGMDGRLVFEKYQKGDLSSIRDYCETDVLNTYLVYLRYQKIRGLLSTEEFNHEEERLKKSLMMMNKPHLNTFLEVWMDNGKTNVE